VDNERKEIAMNTVERGIRETTAESLPEIGGAIVGLTLLGLAGASPVFLVEIATILLCVGYLVRLVVKDLAA
jgi:energy-converting hydrogenase Eha subunit C